jgi:hypothetical protein
MRRVRVLLGLMVVFAAGVGYQAVVRSQTRQPPPPRSEETLKKLSDTAETAGLAEPFKGITANGMLETGLFSLRSTGVSTRGVRVAVEAFLAGFGPEERKRTQFGVDDPEWRRWMNQSFYVRQGVSFLEMTEKQRQLAFGVLAASLSAKGLKLSRDIMHLNETLGELAGHNFSEYGEWRYHMTVMGQPSDREPWGWQIDGHHLVVNYFVLGDQVVVTPYFTGSEPVIARSGKYAGTTILQQEQAAGLAFVNGLDAEQRGKAIVKVSKTGNETLTEAWRDNVVLDYAGVKASDLSPVQRSRLVDLVSLYVGNMDAGHARVKMREVEQYLDRTYFAWIGGTAPDSVFYYRVHSPVILIEFDHQNPVGLAHLASGPGPNREHVHTVMRTPNGNDYGKDLLRQHYLQHPHN